MSYTCLLSPSAFQDYDDAYYWYEERQIGLGERFLNTVKAKIENISLNPEFFSSRRKSKNFREVVVDSFPYVITYKIDIKARKIYIISIHHTKKNPKKKYRRF